MNKQSRCIIGKITNLVNRITDETYKQFQTFDAAGYHLVTGPHYREDDLGIVIPPDFILPDKLLSEMWLRGKLAGAKRNRVVAKWIFGYFSEAVFYGQWCYLPNLDNAPIKSDSWNDNWKEGDDVTDEIGAIFYERHKQEEPKDSNKVQVQHESVN